MTLNLTIPQQMHTDFTPRITVIGVGGGGTNAVDNMIALNLQGVEFVVANTDAQQLMHSKADRRIQLGPHLTQGLGAGAKPEIGRAAAEEAADELARHMEGAHMVFITAGMGGGTGTGAAPVIARMARERGILTVGVVTKPFTFEGMRRAKSADTGITELQQYVDTLIVIPNQNLFRLANERTGWKEAFKMADHVLYMGVRGVTDLMVAPGLVNLDFADIRTVMAEMGKAMMGTGEAEGENRAIRAAEAAISNPLLEDTSMSGARGLLINITGGEDMTLFEVDAAANRIREEVAEDANIIFGSAIDETLSGRVRVSVVATGIDTPAQNEAQRPKLVAVGGAAAEAVAGQLDQTLSPVSGAGGTVGYGQVVTPLVPPRASAPMAAPMSAAPTHATEAAQHYPSQHGLPQQGQAPVQQGPMSLAQFTAAAHALHAAPQPGSGPLAPPPNAPRPSQAAAVRSGLFAEAPQPAAPQVAAPAAGGPPRRNLFQTVTGALRRTPGAAPAPEPIRTEPALAGRPEGVAPAPRPTQGEEMGLEIPAFLRRQSS